MYHYILLFILCASCSIAQSQNFESLSNFGGNGFQDVNAIEILANSNIITVGQFENTVDFDESPNTVNRTAVGGKDLFLKCVDTSNNLLWVGAFGGLSDAIAWSVTSDPQNNIYISGNFSGTIDFDPSNSIVNLTSNGGQDIFVCKYSSSGSLIWARSFGGTLNDNGRELIVNSNEEVVLAGWFRNTINFVPGNLSFTKTSSGGEEAFICKLNSSGIPIWVNTYGSNTFYLERVYSLKFDLNGTILFTGIFGGIVDFDLSTNTFNLISNGEEDAFLAKIDSNGNHIWAKSWGGSDEELSLSLQLDRNRDIIICGSFQGTTDLDPGVTSFNVTSPGSRDGFISKFSNSGNLIWAKTIGTASAEVCNGVEIDNSNNIYAIGYYFITTDFNPGAGVNLTPSGGNINGDGYLLKLTPNGDFKWVYPLNGSGADATRCAIIDKNFNIYLGGNFTGPFDFDPSNSNAVANSIGISDAFVVKLSDCQPTDTVLSIVACNSYNSPSGTYNWTTGGTYSDTLININGCDSVITINLSLDNQYDTTFSTVACNSYISPSGTYTWTTSGTYSDTLLNQNGCDSVLTISLFIKNQSDTTLFALACNSYNSPSGTYTWTTSGTFLDTLVSQNGCDSVIKVNLFITNQNKTITQNGFTLTSNATNSTYQWLDCNNNNAAIRGETNASFTPTQNGDFAVELTENGCKDTSACVMILGVGIANNNFANESFTVSPNPSNGEFNIQFVNSFSGELDIFNSIGQSIYREVISNNNQVDISLNASKGVYFLRLTSNNGETSTSKVIVK
tara:strand:- start:2220 stop:4586 length:2367 start_codon:yes stop_codon:yes gene_type:complete